MSSFASSWPHLLLSPVQPLHTVPSVEMYSRMAVYALSDGSVCVYNPIAPTEETLQEINDAFGAPGVAQQQAADETRS